MAELKVTRKSDGLRIDLLMLGNDKDSILETINGCSTGACACSTDEFKKVETIDIQDMGDSVTVDVTSKTGETIDPNCVSECLDLGATIIDQR